MENQTDALALIAEAAKYPSLDALMMKLGPAASPEERRQLIQRWRARRAELEFKKQKKEEEAAEESDA